MREALITARLQHPSIVPIYEAGRWPDGEPFYAMKLLAGKSLADLIDALPTLGGRLGLLHNVIAVADAIAYAHENRVLHRDLKPANIMVGEFGETIVIDWGLAKDLDADTDATPMPSVPSTPNMSFGDTVAGTVLGTPAYMPPEQAIGEKVDERADVYSLGAVLYHLLGGTIPFSNLSASEAMQRLRVGAIPDIATIIQGVPEDLAAIVRKAMAPLRAQRYPSARELAKDLRRFETGQLVSVRQYSWWEVVRRWVRQRAAIVTVAGAAALALITIGTLSVRRVIEERNVALTERHEAEVARQQADHRGDELVLVQAVTALDRDPTGSLAWLKLHPGLDALAQLRTIASDAQSRGVAHDVLRRHGARVTGVAFGPDGTTLVATDGNGLMTIDDLRTGSFASPMLPPGILWRLARSPDGKTFASTGQLDQLRLVTPGAPDRNFELGGVRVLELEFSPDGQSLAAGAVGGQVWLWNLQTSARRVLPGHTAEVRQLSFSRDGSHFASASYDGTVQLTTLASAETKTIRIPKDELMSVEFIGDGLELATAGSEGTIRLWDLNGAAVAELKGHRGPITRLAVSADGTRIASASRDHTVRLWTAPFSDSRVLEGHTGDVLRVAFSPDGNTIASASSDTTVRLWDVASGDARVLSGHESAVTLLSWSPDGSALASAGLDGSVRVWNVAPRGERVAAGFKQVAMSPLGTSFAGVGHDGKLSVVDPTGLAHPITGSDWRYFTFAGEDRVVGLDGNRDVVLWESSTGTTRTLGRVPVDIGAAVYASGWLAVAAFDGTVRSWRLSNGHGRVWPAHHTYTLTVAASPDGALIASSGDEGQVKLWDANTGESRTLSGHTGPVHHLCFSADGKLLATGDIGGEVRVWNVSTGQTLHQYKDGGFVQSLAFSNDAALLATGGDDKTVHVRELATGATAIFLGSEQAIRDVAFSPDSALLAVASADHAVRVFERTTGQAARILRGHGGTVEHVKFIANGDVLVSTDAEGGVQRWQHTELEPLPKDRAGLERWIDAVTTARIDADHRPATFRSP